MQNNTSKSNSTCDTADAKLRAPDTKAEREPGFLAKRPWLWVIVAFGIMFAAWSVMFAMAIKHQPENVPLATGTE